MKLIEIKEKEEFIVNGFVFTWLANGTKVIFKPIRKYDKKDKPKVIGPTFDEVKSYFKEKGYREDVAKTFFDGYEANEWKDSNQKVIKNWRMKAIQVWFKDSAKIAVSETAFKFEE